MPNFQIIKLLKSLSNSVYKLSLKLVEYEHKFAYKEIKALEDKMIKLRMKVSNLEGRKKYLVDEYGKGEQ